MLLMLWLLRSFGQSAGAASVDFYNYAYTEDPIIAGSILQSGSAPSFANKLPATAEKAWYTVAEKVGCGNSSSGTDVVLECMRSSNTTMVDILAAKQSGENPANVLGNFGPTIDVSEQTNMLSKRNLTRFAEQDCFLQLHSLVGSRKVHQEALHCWKQRLRSGSVHPHHIQRRHQFPPIHMGRL